MNYQEMDDSNFELESQASSAMQIPQSIPLNKLKLSEVKSIVRLRFLNQLNRDHFVRVCEIEQFQSFLSNDYHERAQSLAHSHVVREREIFLRAALQLLDQKEALKVELQTQNSNNMNNRNNSETRKSIYNTSRQQQHSEETEMHDVIRLGLLQKSSRGGALQSLKAVHWKCKYVELRHGLFSYDDHIALNSTNGQSMQTLNHAEHSNVITRRVIQLNVESCVCRLVRTGQKNNDRIFEISVIGGPRRFWMAATHEECLEWVRAIHTAMLGDRYLSSSNRLDWINHITNSIHDGVHHGVGIGSAEDSSLNHDSHAEEKSDVEDNLLCSNSSSGKEPSWLSMEGAAAPYALDMSHFMHLQQTFGTVRDDNEYQEILRRLHQEKVKITIPVLFIKVTTYYITPYPSISLITTILSTE